MKTKNIYIIRHGETDYNLNGMVQGRGIDSSLNATGQNQANKFFEMYKNIPFDKIYTSALKRTKESVQSFIDLGIPFQKMDGFDEISWGNHEGMPYDDVRHKSYEDALKAWSQGNLNHSVSNGETPIEVMTRQRIAMDHVISQTNEETILIATHGRAMRIQLCWMMGKPLQEAEDFPHANLCLYQLTYDGNSYQIIKSADVEHLKS